MADVTYKIGKVKPNYRTSFVFWEMEWQVHRPVNENGTKADTGWQFSFRGVPVARMEIDTKQKALTAFKRNCKKFYGDEPTLMQRTLELLDQNEESFGINRHPEASVPAKNAKAG